MAETTDKHKADRQVAGTSSPAQPQRLLYADIVRVFACFMVFLTHSPRPQSDSTYAVFLVLISYITSPASDLFLSISGALLMPVKTDFVTFYKRRLLRILPPLYLWTIIILGIYCLLGYRTPMSVLTDIPSMFIVTKVSVFWFLYVLLGLYLLAPFTSKWLETSTKGQIEFFLALCMFALSIPYMYVFTGDSVPSVPDHYSMFGFFSGFIGFWILGYYLRLYPIKIGMNFRFILSICGALVSLAILILARIMDLSYFVFFKNLHVGNFFWVALLITFAQAIRIDSPRIRAAIADVAKMSFGMYLVHIVILREGVWRLFGSSTIHPLPESFLIAIISFIICYLVVKVLSYLPKSKYIVGV